MSLFGRSANLLLSSSSQVLDLSNMRFTFEIKGADTETPNIAYVRVYNLSDQTSNSAISEYDKVVVQAGYGDDVGVIFRGTIKQIKRGKATNVDKFLDIYAADSDLGYNYGIVNKTLAAGSNSPKQQLDTLVSAMSLEIDSSNTNDLDFGGVLPRGKVLFGMARQYIRDLCNTAGARWTIDEGVVKVIPLNGYLPGEIVKINSLTGMIGVPEATENGINVRMLLNSRIRIGNRIQLNEKDVTQLQVKQQFFPNYTSAPTYPARVLPGDGSYRVLVIEHTGDTRGTDWYTDVVCLALDPSGSPSVKAFG